MIRRRRITVGRAWRPRTWRITRRYRFKSPAAYIGRSRRRYTPSAKVGALLTLAVALPILVAAAIYREPPAERDPRLSSFDQTTVDGFSDLVRQSGPLRKWRRSITVVLANEPHPAVRRHAVAVVAAIERQTGIAMSVDPSPGASEWRLAKPPPVLGDGVVLVEFPPNKALFHTAIAQLPSDAADEDDDRAACMAHTSLDDTYEIVGARIFIPASHYIEDQQDCFAHELMHAMGFHGHLEKPGTILHPYLGWGRFSLRDKHLLQLLYDDRMLLGFDADQAKAVAVEIVVGGDLHF